MSPSLLPPPHRAPAVSSWGAVSLNVAGSMLSLITGPAPPRFPGAPPCRVRSGTAPSGLVGGGGGGRLLCLALSIQTPCSAPPHAIPWVPWGRGGTEGLQVSAGVACLAHPWSSPPASRALPAPQRPSQAGGTLPPRSPGPLRARPALLLWLCRVGSGVTRNRPWGFRFSLAPGDALPAPHPQFPRVLSTSLIFYLQSGFFVSPGN